MGTTMRFIALYFHSLLEETERSHFESRLSDCILPSVIQPKIDKEN
jgi:hypothetical protein